MSIQAVAWVLSLPPTVAGADRLVLLSLANHADDAWECWPSIATVAAEAGITRTRTVQASLQRLAEKGYVERDVNGAPDARYRHDRRPNLFRLRQPDGVTPTATPSPGTGWRLEPNGVTPGAARGDASRPDGVTPSVTLTISREPSLEPSVEPKGPADAAPADDPPPTPEHRAAHRCAVLAYEQHPKPVVPFPAVMARCKEAIAAGWTEVQVAYVIRHGDVAAWSRGSLEFALNRRRQQAAGGRGGTVNAIDAALAYADREGML